VSGLDPRATEATLLQLFRPFGTVTDWKYFWNRDQSQTTFGTPRGLALVTMRTPDEARRAREALHGKLVGSQRISVRPSIQRVELDANGVVAVPQLTVAARRDHISMLKSKLNAMKSGAATSANVTSANVTAADANATAATTAAESSASSASAASSTATKRKIVDTNDTLTQPDAKTRAVEPK
jgi:RNA recognition motif-containing protein